MKRPDFIKAVSLDVGGTLIDPWPSVGHVYAAAAREAGWPAVDPGVLTTRFTCAWRTRSHFDYSRGAWLELVEETFAGLLPAACRAATFFEPLYDRFTERSAWRIYDDVLPMLRQLRAHGLQLAAISNWDERLRPLLRELELESYFHQITVSAEVGVHKPSAEIFRRTVQGLGLRAEEVLHVGDSKREDLEGARAAGLRALLLRRGESESQDVIGSLESVAGRLKAGGGQQR